MIILSPRCFLNCANWKWFLTVSFHWTLAVPFYLVLGSSNLKKVLEIKSSLLLAHVLSLERCFGHFGVARKQLLFLYLNIQLVFKRLQSPSPPLPGMEGVRILWITCWRLWGEENLPSRSSVPLWGQREPQETEADTDWKAYTLLWALIIPLSSNWREKCVVATAE